MTITLNLSHIGQAPRDPDITSHHKVTSLVGLTLEEMRDAVLALGVEPKKAKMRAQQIWRWVYFFGARSFDVMTDISKDLRLLLEERHTLDRPEVVERLISTDGTRKWLIRSAPGVEFETVFIPDVARSGALCVSSQVGCTLTCTFCHTGTQKLVRNLTAAEIVAQVMIARDDLDEWPSTTDGRTLTNIVFMGMGEPLYNLDEVAKAIDLMSDGEGISIGRRRITVSTSGVVPHIKELGNRTGAMLAISLHATHDRLRDVLVPLNKKYPLGELMAAIRSYPGLNNAKRVTFEYVMLKGVNDSPAEARALVKLLSGIPAKVNLIPFNPWPGSQYECSDWNTIHTFSDIVSRAGYSAPIRTPRGRDILAACGQLRSESVKVRASLAFNQRLDAQASVSTLTPADSG
ncbi:23S rRNA (adenine(2503)-C(2))-methyltransferase RlmN [Candidatus Phycosocius spiralis]|uniref:Dual-specificity RNA methyltransferase RlmN n=1 Tax=Candidatus Phycosocius spiralis TaxID=2815099 RepID=A0ABQ4PYH2_9PROT|nr:23S rRNA (adenine(2503)-C(2))-methyltransferase RlmN [Candidatus Phycosocius spiralis]GIU68029.1 dual-specificity RNA methyltransferase RlmN [Candidatus Phycosocius spiralis]